MGKYADILELKAEIDLITEEIEQLPTLLSEADLNTRRRGARLIKMLEASRSKCIAEHSRLCEELEAIKKEDPEIFSMIYWHDIKGKPWRRVFDITCEGLMSDYPEVYCKKMVSRYLRKRGYE